MPDHFSVGSGAGVHGTMQIQPTAQVSRQVQDSLKGINTGDTLNGKVVASWTDESGNRTAQIDLGNNTLINARMDNSMQLTPGREMAFTVRSNGGGTLTLAPLYQNTAALDATAEKALLAAGLSTDSVMKQMVGEMMNNGMSIGKDSLLQMSHVVNSNPDVNIGILVQMKNLNIPINEGNIAQFQNYQNYQHQVLDGANAIMDQLPDAFRVMVSEGNQTGALDLYGDLMRLFTGQTVGEGRGAGIPADNAAGVNPESAGETAAGTGTASQAGNTGNAADALNILTGDKSANGQTAANTSANVSGQDSAVQDGNARQTVNDGSSQNTSDSVQAQNAQTLNKMVDGLAGGTAEARSQIAQSNSSSLDSMSNALKFMNEQSIKSFVSAMKNAGVSSSQLEGLLSKSVMENPSALMKQLSDLFQQTAHSSRGVDQAFGRLFSSESFTNLLKENIASQWLIHPDDVGDKKNVRDLYERLNTQTKELTQLLQNSIGEKNPAFQSSQNLSQNLDFMNQMNQMYAYVQLPLKMSGNDAHGDLYVYSNKRHLARDDGSVSALLHLDMANLGPLDVYVRMSEMKVSTNFYLADEDCMDLIEAHIDELTDRLNKRGYTAKYQILKAGEQMSEDAAVDELLQKGDRVKLLSSSSFDARA